MKVVSVISSKGGSGKTTIALNLATLAAATRSQVAVFDLDPGKSAESWGERRLSDHGTLSPSIFSAPPASLDTMLETAREHGVDLVIVDTPSGIQRSTLAAVAAADVILVVSRPSSLDRTALRETLEYVQMTRRLDKCVVAINGYRSSDASGLELLLEETKRTGVPVARILIEDDPGVAKALEEGQGAAEFDPESKSAKSMKALYRDLKLALSRGPSALGRARPRSLRNPQLAAEGAPEDFKEVSVFVSYAREDKQHARALVEMLRQNGVGVVWDEDLRPGVDYDTELEKAIRTCMKTVVIWSEPAVRSRYVLDEATLALELGKLVPVHVAGYDTTRLPMRFRRLQSAPVEQHAMLISTLRL